MFKGTRGLKVGLEMTDVDTASRQSPRARPRAMPSERGVGEEAQQLSQQFAPRTRQDSRLA